MSSPLLPLLHQAQADLARKHRLEETISNLSESLDLKKQQHQDLLDAQRLLSSISEENTARTLDYVTGVINRALAEIFQDSSRSITLTKNLHAGRYAHINVELTTKANYKRDLDLQTGSGVKEVVSFLFTVCLIAVRGGRRFLIMDELLSGLHSEAKSVIADLMGVFAEEGFQFVMVEYGLDNHNGRSFGKILNVESVNGASSVVPVPDGLYTPVRYL